MRPIERNNYSRSLLHMAFSLCGAKVYKRSVSQHVNVKEPALMAKTESLKDKKIMDDKHPKATRRLILCFDGTHNFRKVLITF